MLARHENIHPPLDLNRILKSYFKRKGRRKFQEKQEQTIPHDINRAAWLIKNGKEFSVNSWETFLSWYQSSRPARN